MSVLLSDQQSIEALPCFSGKCVITPLTTGLSHRCYKVKNLAKCYFVKRLNEGTANTEINALSFLQTTSNPKLTVEIICYKNQWLVTDFIEEPAFLNKSKNDKIDTCLALMTKLHGISLDNPNKILEFPLPKLTVEGTAKELILKIQTLDDNTLSTLNAYACKLAELINTKHNAGAVTPVLCHGDINFGNILTSQKSDVDSYLIDFECALIGPIEYDIAMFIAVNILGHEVLPTIIGKYHTLNNHHNADVKLVECLLLYCHFINGLWYLNSSINSNDFQKVYQLAEQQWHQHDQLLAKVINDVDSNLERLIPLLYSTKHNSTL